MIDAHHGWNVSFKPLILGFIFSIILTIAAYRIVMYYHLTHSVLTYTIMGIAFVQTCIQLFFFLHLGMESTRPRWNLLIFLFMVVLVVVVIAGSLWIMENLNYNVM